MELNISMKIYLIGSLRNQEVPVYANKLRELGFEVFDDWYAVGPKADDHWLEYEKARGHTYAQALQGHAARNTFHFDKRNIDQADVGVLIYPAGKSAHLELGYMIGKQKPAYIFIPQEPERWDVMTQFATGVTQSFEELVALMQTTPTVAGCEQ
jgi:nucleoside 2-deoxyribosyltransferase